MRGDGGPRRRVLGRRSLVAILLGLLFANLAMISLWSWRTFADSQGFADVTTDMLEEPAVREIVAEQIIDAIQDQEAVAHLAATARPALEVVAEELVASDRFQGVFHTGVRELHRAIVEGRRSRLIVNVNDATPLVRQSLELTNPELAQALPDDALEAIVGISQSTPLDTAMRVSSIAGWLIAPVAVLAVGSFVVAVRSAVDRRRALEVIGLGLVATGVAHFALLAAGLNVVASVGETDGDRTALRAVYWSVTSLLNVQAKVFITIGTVLAIAAAYAGTGEIRSRLGMLRDAIGRGLQRPGWRAAASLAAIAVGFLAMRWPEATTSIAIRTVAFLGFVAGAIGLLDVLGSVDWVREGVDPRPTHGAALRHRDHRRDRGHHGDAALRRPRLRPGVAVAQHRPTRDQRDGLQRQPRLVRSHPRRSGPRRHPQLDGRHRRRLLRSEPDRQASAPNSPRASAPSCSTSTTESTETGTSAPTSAAGPMRKRRGSSTPTIVPSPRVSRHSSVRRPTSSEVYLCHVYCEVGATRAVDTFRVIDDYLRENPNEVIVLILEDHVDAADAVDVLKKSGLGRHALQWDPGDPLPTLREMIRRRRNVLVLAENEGGAEPWYVPAYDAMEETPYRFDSRGEFSCEENRGVEGNPLLLVNHWVTTGDPLDAGCRQPV